MPAPIEVGIVLREQDLRTWSGRLHELAARTVAAGVGHLTVGDHVSFADGHGADGLIQAAALLSADPRIAPKPGGRTCRGAMRFSSGPASTHRRRAHGSGSPTPCRRPTRAPV
ncbi:MAG: hypothetical protein ACXVUE_01025 [Solirubrobacteraceae bacterium]